MSLPGQARTRKPSIRFLLALAFLGAAPAHRWGPVKKRPARTPVRSASHDFGNARARGSGLPRSSGVRRPPRGKREEHSPDRLPPQWGCGHERSESARLDASSGGIRRRALAGRSRSARVGRPTGSSTAAEVSPSGTSTGRSVSNRASRSSRRRASGRRSADDRPVLLQEISRPRSRETAAGCLLAREEGGPPALRYAGLSAFDAAGRESAGASRARFFDPSPADRRPGSPLPHRRGPVSLQGDLEPVRLQRDPGVLQFWRSRRRERRDRGCRRAELWLGPSRASPTCSSGLRGDGRGAWWNPRS